MNFAFDVNTMYCSVTLRQVKSDHCYFPLDFTALIIHESLGMS